MRRITGVPRVRALAFSLGVLLVLALRAAASAAQSISVSSPAGFPAGGDPTFTTTTTLDSSAGTASV